MSKARNWQINLNLTKRCGDFVQVDTCVMRFCCDCKYFYGKESRIDDKFIDREFIGEFDNGKPIPNLLECYSEGGFIKACQHPTCFEDKIIIDKVNGITKKRKRIAGQAQLNKNFNCKYFQRKWWKFWKTA